MNNNRQDVILYIGILTPSDVLIILEGVWRDLIFEVYRLAGRAGNARRKIRQIIDTDPQVVDDVPDEAQRELQERPDYTRDPRVLIQKLNVTGENLKFVYLDPSYEEVPDDPGVLGDRIVSARVERGQQVIRPQTVRYIFAPPTLY